VHSSCLPRSPVS